MGHERFAGLRAALGGPGIDARVVQLGAADLGDGEVLVEVAYSDLNYKDALAMSPKGRVARIDPLVPGIDLAGVVVESADGRHPVGSMVAAFGGVIGVARSGGFAQYARVPSELCIALPAGVTPRESMAVGTAGFTAALSIERLEQAGVSPGDGEVLVTAATGGVGSMAVAMLAARGYQVVASTGKAEQENWLRELGAQEVLGRLEVSGRPLSSGRWAAVVDSAGGDVLAQALTEVRYGGVVAASGLTAGTALATTVTPFILRAVSLLGIDSVQCPRPARQRVWERIAADLRRVDLEALISDELTLDQVPQAAQRLLDGGARGRYLVRVGGTELPA